MCKWTDWLPKKWRKMKGVKVGLDGWQVATLLQTVTGWTNSQSSETWVARFFFIHTTQHSCFILFIFFVSMFLFYSLITFTYLIVCFSCKAPSFQLLSLPHQSIHHLSIFLLHPQSSFLYSASVNFPPPSSSTTTNIFIRHAATFLLSWSVASCEWRPSGRRVHLTKGMMAAAAAAAAATTGVNTCLHSCFEVKRTRGGMYWRKSWW